MYARTYLHYARWTFFCCIAIKIYHVIIFYVHQVSFSMLSAFCWFSAFPVAKGVVRARSRAAGASSGRPCAAFASFVPSLVTSDNEALQPNEKASDFQHEFGLVFHVKPYRTSKNFVYLWEHLPFSLTLVAALNDNLSIYWSFQERILYIIYAHRCRIFTEVAIEFLTACAFIIFFLKTFKFRNKMF